MSDVRLRGIVFAVALLTIAASASPAVARVPDPMRPAVAMPAPATAGATTAEAAPPPLVLQSTLVSPRQRSAIINGQRYRLGERIGDARIEAIGPGWVRLATPTGREELRLSFSTSTRPVNR